MDLAAITVAINSLDKMEDHEKSSFLRCASQLISTQAIDWRRVEAPTAGVVQYDNLINTLDTGDILECKLLLDQIAVVKLAGGQGSKMGCITPKLLTRLFDRDDVNNPFQEPLDFLDITVKQLEHLNTSYSCKIPLILLDSYKTHSDIEEVLTRYEGIPVNIKLVTQMRHPRLNGQLMPLPSTIDRDEAWCTSGHGDIFEALIRSKVLDELLSDGRKYIFISNMDNLGATIDLRILNQIIQSKNEFCMEVTDQTVADTGRGGSLVSYEGKLQLLELLQLPDGKNTSNLGTVDKLGLHNTNNLWVNLQAIKRLFGMEPPTLDVLYKMKEVKALPETTVVELKTAAGSAIKYFQNSMGVFVSRSRSRFLPVRTTSDLMLLQSKLFKFCEDATFVRSNLRGGLADPVITLKGFFKKVTDYRGRLGCMGPNKKVKFEVPDIVELQELQISGNVFIGNSVKLMGNVTIRCTGDILVVEDGRVLNNEVYEN